MDQNVKSPETLSRMPLRRGIRDALVQQIVSGELAAGQRLVETRLASAFGTSQSPVREALRELEGIGMVEVLPRRGTFVRHFVQQTLRESYVVRAALEETATRLAILHGSLPADRLRDAVEAMREAARRDSSVAMCAASVAFHRHVVAAADNELLLHSWESLQIEARTSVTLLAVNPDLTFVAEDHAQLLETLTGADLEAACRHARDHQWNYADLPHDAHGRAVEHPAVQYR